MIMSKRRNTEMMRHDTCAAFDGVEKNRRAMRRRPRAKVVNEKSKNPDPRECIPGGLMKIDTSSRTHHRKVITVNNTVK